MKQYRIFRHPVGTVEAIKQGWSWPAFFFNFIWAFVKKLWKLGVTVLVLAFAIGIVLDAIAEPPIAENLSNIVGILISLLFGFRGNIWREQNLLARGFEHVDSLRAPNPESAIAAYLKPSDSPSTD